MAERDDTTAASVFVLFRDTAAAVTTSATPLAERSDHESRVGAATDRILVTTAWSPPYESYDSLTIDRPTLRPIEETVTSRRARYHYRYDNARVVGTAQLESGSVAVDRTFDERVFAFNELELLVRSLRYHAGDRFVVPLFSEADRNVEHDTLRVVGSVSTARSRVWTIDFADPVITTRYRVDEASRRILDATTVQRKSGIGFRMRQR